MAATTASRWAGRLAAMTALSKVSRLDCQTAEYLAMRRAAQTEPTKVESTVLMMGRWWALPWAPLLDAMWAGTKAHRSVQHSAGYWGGQKAALWAARSAEPTAPS